jgi:hypothetical protein
MAHNLTRVATACLRLISLSFCKTSLAALAIPFWFTRLAIVTCIRQPEMQSCYQRFALEQTRPDAYPEPSLLLMPRIERWAIPVAKKGNRSFGGSSLEGRPAPPSGGRFGLRQPSSDSGFWVFDSQARAKDSEDKAHQER